METKLASDVYNNIDILLHYDGLLYGHSFDEIWAMLLD